MTPKPFGPARSTPVNLPYVRSQIAGIPDLEQKLKEEVARGAPTQELSEGIRKLKVLRQLVESEDALARKLRAEPSGSIGGQSKADALQAARKELEATARQADAAFAAFQQLKKELFPLGDEEMIAKAHSGSPQHNRLLELILEWRGLKARCAVLEASVRRLQ